jgi:hypothetical protein
MKFYGVVVLVIAVLGVSVFLAAFGGMAFIDKFAEMSIRRMKDAVVEDALFRVVEVEHSLPPLPYEYRPGSGDVPAAREILLTPAGELQEGRRVFDKDPNRTVRLLESTEGWPDKVFDGNDIFARSDGHLGERLHSFAEPSLQILRYVGGINDDWFLLAGDPEGSPYTNTKLWQVSRADYSRSLLAEDPYFTFDRPPRLFRPEGFAGTVLVYYTGSVDFGFGGDSSRPKHSVIRLFTEDYPSGHDVARFAFRAGTIVDIKYENGALILYGDPSRPGSEKRLPPRLWRLEKSNFSRF